MMSEERMWAMALCEALRCRRYNVGSFALALANAALVADSSNLAKIGQGFPGLLSAHRRWEEIGADYLMALAAGDEAGMEAAYLDRQEELTADHERWLADSLA